MATDRRAPTKGASEIQRVVIVVAQAQQMMSEQPPPLRIFVDASAALWRVARLHPVNPAFVRISEAQRRLLAGDVAFGSGDLRDIGLPPPRLRPESGVVIELERVGGT
ncbi:MAG: hypothetical protein HY245_15520 [Rhizobiales bacterium]|nr:hypothetical protein [Hyphomicrobiales bacterium]MBI3674796.1 hypothetical protein [Hyphomicrobiales bacterium]